MNLVDTLVALQGEIAEANIGYGGQPMIYEWVESIAVASRRVQELADALDHAAHACHGGSAENRSYHGPHGYDTCPTEPCPSNHALVKMAKG